MKEDEQNLIEVINSNVDKIDINNINSKESQKIKNNDENENDMDKKNVSFSSSSFVSYNSMASKGSSYVNQSLESVPFKEEIDLDLPNFTSTKYNSFTWIIIHTILYSFFSVALLIDTIFFILKKNIFYLKIVSDLFFFGFNFMNWFHYKRGCIGFANLNSKIKTNIDNSIKAKLLRSEIGWKYFFGLIGNVILIYSDIYFLAFSKGENPDYWNINFAGLLIICLSQILKLEKILTNNRQYSVMNDLPNCFIEIFLFFGCLFFSVAFLIQMCYYYKQDFFKLFIIILKAIGAFLVIISEFSLIFRYFFSSYDDLNTSELSNATV